VPNSLKSVGTFFVLLGFVFGVCFIVVTPPFQVPDAQSHYLRAYEISEGELLGVNKMHKSGGYFPQQVFDMQNSFHYLQSPWNSSNWSAEKLSYWSIKYPLFKSEFQYTDSGQRAFHVVVGTNSYPPLLYIPWAAVMLLGRVVHLKLLFTYYICEFFNLLLFLYIGRKSILLVSTDISYLFALVLLSPMSLSLATSVNPNGILIALSSFLAGLFYKNVHEASRELSR